MGSAKPAKEVDADPGDRGLRSAVDSESESMKAKFLRRIKILIEEFEKFGNKGFVYMDEWVNTDNVPESDMGRGDRKFIIEAGKNPCGTAACIAGKAGLMPRFRRLGFKYNIYWGSFNVSADRFFGESFHEAVFVGRFAVSNVHTPKQAVILMKAFLEDVDRAEALGVDWVPNERVRNRITKLTPDVKTFPVSNLFIRLVRAKGQQRSGALVDL